MAEVWDASGPAPLPASARYEVSGGGVQEVGPLKKYDNGSKASRVARVASLRLRLVERGLHPV